MLETRKVRNNKKHIQFFEDALSKTEDDNIGL
jgi:hypothetical protein